MLDDQVVGQLVLWSGRSMYVHAEAGTGAQVPAIAVSRNVKLCHAINLDFSCGHAFGQCFMPKHGSG